MGRLGVIQGSTLLHMMDDEPRRDLRVSQPQYQAYGQYYGFATVPPSTPHPAVPPPTNPFAFAESPLQLPNLTNPQRPQLMALPPPSGPAVQTFHQHSLSADSASGPAALPSFRDPGGRAALGPQSPNIDSSSFPMSSLAAHKRAFRQRRKDPSCDACRERKVKCDATDTLSCSECSSRNIKCQFTKETNRRMSSIKQVQDLERQLAQARQQILQLKSLLGRSNEMDVDSTTVQFYPTMRTVESSSGEQVLQRPPRLAKYDQARGYIRKFSRGLFRPPPLYRGGEQPPQTVSPDPPRLPPKEVADLLVAAYYDIFSGSYLPFFWPDFMQDYDRVYKNHSLAGMPTIWISLFFSILAIGTLGNPNMPDQAVQSGLVASSFFHEAVHAYNNSTDEITIDHCRIALSLSIYCVETNVRSAGRTWLAVAISSATEIGLQKETSAEPRAETRLKRRVWRAILSWDRLLSLDTSAPLQVSDDDFKDTSRLSEEESYTSLPQLPLTSPRHRVSGCLDIILPLVDQIGLIKKALKDPVIASNTLQTCDSYIESVALALPESLRPNSVAYVDPSLLWISSAVNNAYLILHRHNLSPRCSSGERTTALERCASAARATALLIDRSLQPPLMRDSGVDYSWESLVRSAPSSLLCMHLWRCTLILCLALDFAAALTCVRVSSALGPLRKINTACGRNLSFFLDQLTTSIRTAQTHNRPIDADEELLAYASGDLQGDQWGAWVWMNEDDGMSEHNHPTQQDHPTESGKAQREDSVSDVTLKEAEAQDWGGWQRIDQLLTNLLHEQQRRMHPTPHAEQSPGSEASPRSAVRLGFLPFGAGSSDRISIANIM